MLFSNKIIPVVALQGDFAPYQPREVGSSSEFGSLRVSNNGHKIDENRRSIHIMKFGMVSNNTSEYVSIKHFVANDFFLLSPQLCCCNLPDYLEHNMFVLFE